MVEHERDDFELPQGSWSAEGEGPARRIDAAHAERLLAGVLAGTAGGAASAGARPRAGLRAALIGGALVLATSAAAMYAVQRAGEPPERVSEPPEPPRAAVSAPSATDAPKPEPVAAPAVQAPVPAPAVEPAQDGAPGPRDAALDLLERANRLRGDGEYRAAERTYVRVVELRPRSAAAYAARVAAASLRLERLRDARGALPLYRDALRAQPRGSLTPEIHEGMAQAERALGRPAAERAALEALLRTQPSGPAAERARARLAELAR